jgi:capsular exopolysaccharide synthesis family protein
MSNQQIIRSLDEHYRALYQRIRSLLTGVESATIGVTSCVEDEGVTTVAAQLAQVAAVEQEQAVLFIDANTSHSSGTPGLSNIMSDNDGLQSNELAAYFDSTDISNLSVLSSGSAESHSTYSSDRFEQLLVEIRKSHPWIFVDLPPAGELSECQVFATGLDGILLVVEAERVRNQVVRRTKEQLLQAGVTLLGVVFNKRKNHVPNWLYRRL